MSKRFIPISILLVVLYSVRGLSSEPVRTWENTEGKKIEARLLSRTDENVTILLTDGRVFIVPIEMLSPADQAYLLKEEAPPVVGPENGWFVDAEKATQAAEASKRPVLMLFTGSDWCGYCINLEDNVLSKSTWESFAKENLVLLKVDFPRRKKLSKSQSRENSELQKKYGIRGFPTLVLVDASGKKINQFGYGGQSPKDFISLVEGKL